ncbi:MAG TPA: succinylglutamate desuccinylase/aspartoacylase family protein, partial [Noviherbaspirillum sp.]|nr:succinylglutamate desuccinylase/aspartoacylase family protein [Noviherbaspirillum sp.]
MSAATGNIVSARVRALAAGDFAHIAASFSAAGFTVQTPGPGILQLTRPESPQSPIRLLLSAGIHGDETAPIEMLADLLHMLASTPRALVPDLMVVVGNPDAIESGARFIDADLNRLFRDDRGKLASTMEARRADAIMHATSSFFSKPDIDKWHFDLHTAIRPSLYPTFAIVPDSVFGGQ